MGGIQKFFVIFRQNVKKCRYLKASSTASAQRIPSTAAEEMPPA